MTTHAITPARLATDDDLVGRVRGDADATAAAELWVRYHQFGVHAAHVARGRSDDAEFVAAEAFTALLGSLCHGAATDDPFSLLLARRVSQAAASPADAAAHDGILDDPAAFDDPDAAGREPQADALEQSVLREAFAALPDDSRSALWGEVAGGFASGQGLGRSATATGDPIARVRDDLRAMYVATLVSRDAVVPACRSYITELPALVAGRVTSSEALVHATGCHRCASRVDQLRDLEYAVPSAVLPLLAPLAIGTTLPLLGTLPPVVGTHLDIVPHPPSGRPLSPHQAARWMVGGGLAASFLVAATAIWSTTPAVESPVSARGSAPSLGPARDQLEPEPQPGVGDPGSDAARPGVSPEGLPEVPPVAEQPPTAGPSATSTPRPSDLPGTGGLSGSGANPSQTPSGPVQTPGEPAVPATPSRPTATVAPAIPTLPVDLPVRVGVTAATDDGKRTAAVRFDVPERATEVELVIDPPKQVKVDRDAVAGDLDTCRKRDGGALVCVGTPAADGSVAADIQLDWPADVLGSVSVHARVLGGDGVGSVGKGVGSPTVGEPTSEDQDQRSPDSDRTTVVPLPSPSDEARPGAGVEPRPDATDTVR
ncbi:MAG: hypothetical protein ACRCYX_08480 [Dermatophilaceae bacterium]